MIRMFSGILEEDCLKKKNEISRSVLINLLWIALIRDKKKKEKKESEKVEKNENQEEEGEW